MDTNLLWQGAQAVAALGALGSLLGAVLGVAARRLSVPEDDRAEAVAALLPGSNCAQCGFAGCIGCTRCIRKCTADAIVGAAKQMHTILPEACHACELCATECPTQAIAMKPVLPTLDTWHWPKPAPAAVSVTR